MNEITLRPLPDNPIQRTIKVHNTTRRLEGFAWRTPLQITIALMKGMLMTWRHLFRKPVTFNYPNIKRRQSVRFRGIHRLQRHPDGLERCVACGLCGAVCPSDAIFLEGKENTPENRVSHGERYAVHYQIDMLRCIFCGFLRGSLPGRCDRSGRELGERQHEPG